MLTLYGITEYTFYKFQSLKGFPKSGQLYPHSNSITLSLSVLSPSCPNAELHSLQQVWSASRHHADPPSAEEVPPHLCGVVGGHGHHHTLQTHLHHWVRGGRGDLLWCHQQRRGGVSCGQWLYWSPPPGSPTRPLHTLTGESDHSTHLLVSIHLTRPLHTLTGEYTPYQTTPHFNWWDTPYQTTPHTSGEDTPYQTTPSLVCRLACEEGNGGNSC